MTALDWDRHDSDSAICPHCEYANGDMWEVFTDLEGCHEVDCGECGETFHVARSCSFTYTTAKPAPTEPSREVPK